MIVKLLSIANQHHLECVITSVHLLALYLSGSCPVAGSGTWGAAGCESVVVGLAAALEWAAQAEGMWLRRAPQKQQTHQAQRQGPGRNRPVWCQMRWQQGCEERGPQWEHQGKRQLQGRPERKLGEWLDLTLLSVYLE